MNGFFRKRWFLAALVFLSILINVWFRLGPFFLANFDRQAKEEIYAEYTVLAAKTIDRIYPQLAGLSKDSYAQALIRQLLKEERQEINQKIRIRSKELKDFYRDSNGFTYLLEIDPYRWLRRISTFLTSGHFGTFQNAGLEYDELMSFPSGAKIEPLKFHFYIGAFFSRVAHAINPRLSTMNALAVLPVFLSIILIALIFLVALQLGISYLGAFIASLAVGLCVLSLGRTNYGWFDTDIYNFIMPLSIVSLAASSFKYSKFKKGFLLVAGGLLVGVFSALWSIWWLFFYIFVAGMMLNAVEHIVSGFEGTLIRRAAASALPVLLFMISSYVFVAVISGFGALQRSVSEPFFYLTIRQGVALDDFWPNLAFSVSELKKADIRIISALIGGPVILYGGLLGQLSTYTVRKQSFPTKENKFIMFILFCWFLSSLFLTNFGTRFVTLLIIPLGLHFGVFWDLIVFLIEKLKPIHRQLRITAFVSVFLLMCALPIYNASQFSNYPVFMNDLTWNMMMKIRESTPRNALIYASWDAGDFIMALAGRATVHDASWQYNPVTYWFDRAMVVEKEEETFAILRMLNAGGNKAFEELRGLFAHDKFKAMEVLNAMFLLPLQESRKLLNGYTKDQPRIERILQSMYSPKVPAYLLIDTQMAITVPVLGLVGRWDFAKLLLWQKARSLTKEQFVEYAHSTLDYDKEEAEKIYIQLGFIDKSDILYWISKDTFKIHCNTAFTRPLADDTGMLLFNNGLAVDRQDLKAYFSDFTSDRWIVPGYVQSIIDGKIRESQQKSGDEEYAAFIGKEDVEYKSIVISRDLMNTVFFKLYFAEGAGLKHFELVHRESGKGRHKLLLYKIAWDVPS